MCTFFFLPTAFLFLNWVSLIRTRIGQHGSGLAKKKRSAARLTPRLKPFSVFFSEFFRSVVFYKRLGLFLSQQELTSRSSHRFSNVPAIPTCHSWAQGRGKKGRRHSGAGGMVAAGERCSWPRPVLSFPQKAVASGGWWIQVVLALLGTFEAASSWLSQQCSCHSDVSQLGSRAGLRGSQA